MTKVTFCVYDKPDSVGGPVTWIQRLIPALEERGIEARCLFLLHWGDTGPALRSLTAKGIQCTSMIAPVNTVERVRWILQRLKENPPDVFVPNLVVAGFYAGRWARVAGIPTIGVLHSDDDYYRAIQDEFVFGDRSYRVSSLVCVSTELERQVNERRANNVLVKRIAYGVPIPRQSVPAPDGVMRIAYVGRLAQEQKRILDVTRALTRAVKEVPGTEAVLYGDGPQRDEVLQILSQNSETDQIRFAGVLPSDSIQTELLKCHVIVLLSDYEGLPIALLEAMACGCVPVCLQMRSGIPELVVDGVSGVIVSNRDDAFIAALKLLRERKDIWKTLSSGAKATAMAYANETSCDRWRDLIHEVKPSGGRTKVRVPFRIPLPARNPYLESMEQREQTSGIAIRAYRRGRILAGRLRRRVFPFP